MKLLATILISLGFSTAAMAQMTCTQEFGETVCRDMRAGIEIRCREAFGERVCRNARTGEVISRCRMVFNQYVCR